MQSTSTKPTYSRRKEIPLVSSKSKVKVEPSKEESWWETYQRLFFKKSK